MPAGDDPVPPGRPPAAGNPGGDEEVAMLLAQHGALRHADVETIDRYLGRPPRASAPPRALEE